MKLTLDTREFDPGYQNSNYSFVDSALAAGYAVVNYDRLGTGLSSLPDGYNDLQTPLQGEVLKALTVMALDGTLVSESEITGGNASLEYTTDKIVHVGHSYGSIITNWFLGQYGNLSSGAILTGFLLSNESAELKLEVGDLAYAPEYDPQRYGNRTGGYLAFGTMNAFQLDSFRSETLDPGMLLWWNTTIQGTTSVGELLSLGVGVGDTVTEFTGPLKVRASSPF